MNYRHFLHIWFVMTVTLKGYMSKFFVGFFSLNFYDINRRPTVTKKKKKIYIFKVCRVVAHNIPTVAY